MMAPLLDVIAILACAAAVVGDLRNRKIPNTLVVVAIACGLGASAMFGVEPLLGALAGGAVGFAVFGVPAAFGWVGMGDVKLAIAVGALLHWPLALAFVLYASVAGGVVSAIHGLRGGRRDQVPYGVAIALGCAWAVASRYIDVLRLV